MKGGKALVIFLFLYFNYLFNFLNKKKKNERKAEIRIQFKSAGSQLFPGTLPNELVMRLQPNEAIYLKMMMKTPGLSNELVESELG